MRRSTVRTVERSLESKSPGIRASPEAWLVVEDTPSLSEDALEKAQADLWVMGGTWEWNFHQAFPQDLRYWDGAKGAHGLSYHVCLRELEINLASQTGTW